MYFVGLLWSIVLNVSYIIYIQEYLCKGFGQQVLLLIDGNRASYVFWSKIMLARN